MALQQGFRVLGFWGLGFRVSSLEGLYGFNQDLVGSEHGV